MPKIKITQEQRESGFDLSLAFYRDEISFSDAVKQLTRTGMKEGSAKDYVRYIQEYMKIDNIPVRTMSKATQSLFLEGVLEHLGEEALQQWAINDRKHFDYYESVQNGNVVGRRKNLEKFLKEHVNSTSTAKSTHPDIYLFNQYYNAFKTFVEEKSGVTFDSFSSNNYTQEQEGYKDQLFLDARTKLNFGKWSKSDIGSGKIVQALISTIELDNNNLVNWRSKYGDNKRPHHKLYIVNNSEILIYEQKIFDFYNSKELDEDVFTWFINEFGKQYAFIAYLFFLKDKSKYMPIAPTTFDKAFELLNIDFKTNQKACWENYKQYNEILSEVKILLERAMDNDVQLLEAHSFLWIIARQMQANEVTIEKQKDYIETSETYKEAVVKSRIGQGQYRKDLISYWQGCAVTGTRMYDMLIASHIKPWRRCTYQEALDKFNGLLLTPTLDKAFDLGYISFDDNGVIIISKELSDVEIQNLSINRESKITNLDERHYSYLKYHREVIFDKFTP